MRKSKIIKTYIRRDNLKTWVPMISTLAGFFIPTIISSVYKSNSVLYWILFSTSFLCIIAFLILSYNYVNRGHAILEMLHDKDINLYKSCAFLAIMEKSKRINQVMEVSSITISYIFDKQLSIFDQREYLPYHVRYKVDGIARKQFTNLYFHLVAHKGGKVYNSLKATINGSECEKAIEDQIGKVCVIKLSSNHRINKRESTSYVIDMDFLKQMGLSAESKQRFLFYPMNTSAIFSNNPKIRMELVFSKKVYDDFIQNHFRVIYLRKYFGGATQDIANDALAPIKHFDDKENTITLSWEFELEKDNYSTLYAVELYGENIV